MSKTVAATADTPSTTDFPALVTQLADADATTTTPEAALLRATTTVQALNAGHPAGDRQDDGAREHTEPVETPLMSAFVTALPEFGLNNTELLCAELYVPNTDAGSAEISLNSQGNGQLFTPDQADDFANKVIVWGQTVKAMADTARDHNDDVDETDIYMPKLLRECERLGLALQLTDDPAIDLATIQAIDGRRTLIARADGVPVAYDDVHPVGRCIECNSLLDDTALPFVPANAVPGYGGGKHIDGTDIKICQLCFTASGLPLTAAQRGPEWMAKYECTPWCVMDHADTDGAPGWHQGLTVKVTAPTSTFGTPYSKEPESVVLAARITQTTEEANAYGLETQIWLDVDAEILELSPQQARTLFTAMQRIMPALQSMCQQAEWLARGDYPGDPEIRARKEAEQAAHAKAIGPRCADASESTDSSQAA